MVAATARETFESYADGASVTAITGGGTVPTSTKPIARSAAAIKGSRGAEVGGTDISVYGQWTFTDATIAGFQIYFEKTSTNPTGAAHILGQIRTSAGPQVSANLLTSGILQVTNAAGSTAVNLNGNAQLPVGKYVLSVVATRGTTTSNGRIQVWLRDASTDALIGTAYDNGTQNTGTTDFTVVRLGKGNATGVSTVNVDELAYATGSATEIDRSTTTVGPVNNPPTATIGAGTPTTAVQNDTVPLRGTVADTDGTVTAAWSITSWPATMTGPPAITNPTSTTAASFVAVAPGTYTARLTATDNAGATATADRTITVTQVVAGGGGPKRWNATTSTWE